MTIQQKLQTEATFFITRMTITSTVTRSNKTLQLQIINTTKVTITSA
jgi:hypothetical protein